MGRPSYSIELSCEGIVIGVDEVGCGPWAGPVVAAATFLNPHKRVTGLDDSKKLKIEERESLYAKLMKHAHSGVGIATVEEIDQLNIREARRLAMLRAIAATNLIPALVLVDGNCAPEMPYAVQTVVGGDSKCMCIAAASIIAKVTRDRMMAELAQQYPGYGWETNAGYGTTSHQKGLAELGVTPHHRKSFAPVRALLDQKETLLQTA